MNTTNIKADNSDTVQAGPGELGRRCSGGFSLTELMIVVATISILVGLALFSISRVRKHIRESSNNMLLDTLEKGLASYKTDLGAYPPSDGSGWMKRVRNDWSYDEDWQGCMILAWSMLGMDNDIPKDGSKDPYVWDRNEGLGFRAKKRGKVYGPYVDPGTPTKMVINPDSGKQRAVIMDANEQPVLYYRKVANVGAAHAFDDQDNRYVDPPADVNLYVMRDSTVPMNDRPDLPDFLMCTQGVDGKWWPVLNDANQDDDLTNLE